MTLTREARDGLSRVWLDILKERHPGIAWVLVDLEEHVLLSEELELSEAA